MNYSLLFNEIKRTEAYKGMKYANPLITQEFGADPYAMVYDDTVYIYMTQDVFEKSSDGTIKDNSYSKIKSIRVISSKDMVNWTDHGEIYVADGIVGAKWAKIHGRLLLRGRILTDRTSSFSILPMEAVV